MLMGSECTVDQLAIFTHPQLFIFISKRRMVLTSCSLSAIPFLGQTDATRLSMSSKQMSQALTCLDSEIPYVISSNYRDLRCNSKLGIRIAEDDGKIIYRNSDIIIWTYDKLKRIEHNMISPTQKTHGNFASELRNTLNVGQSFQKGDVIYEYDCFRKGIPSFGFNTFAAFFPFFGFNHEDSLTISQSFARKSKAKYIEKIYIPIYENTIIHKIYANVPGSFKYFPALGQKIKNDVVYRCYLPKDSNYVKIGSSMKTRTLDFLKKLKVSGLLSMTSMTPSGFVANDIKSKLSDAVISGIKIHYLDKNATLLDHELEVILKNLYNSYAKFAVDVYTDIQQKINEEFARNMLKRYYVFADRDTIRNNVVDLKHAVFLLELELTKEEQTEVGDKLAK